MELCYLKALWDDQGKFNMYHGMSRVKKQLSGKRSIIKITIKKPNQNLSSCVLNKNYVFMLNKKFYFTF